jgi:hypothetical protein
MGASYLGHYGTYVCMVSQLRGVACIGLRDYSITVCRFFLHRGGGDLGFGFGISPLFTALQSLYAAYTCIKWPTSRISKVIPQR